MKAVWLRRPITPVDLNILPFRHQPELIQTIGQRDGGDAPALLGAENLVDAADIGNSGNQIGVGHQKRRGELIGFGLRFPPLRSAVRSEEHTSELQSLMRISYAVFCLKKKKKP